MSHPLQDKVQALGRQARWLLVLYGISWVVAIGLLAVLAVGLADWLFRFEDPGIRLMATACVLLAGGWAIGRYLWTAARQRWDDVAIALRIERRFPELNDRLASTIQFLNEADDDPKAGSAMLRRAVINDTTAAVGRLNLAEAIEARPTMRITLAAVGICAVAATVAIVAPNISQIALARLINPLGDDAWPQQNHLQMREAITRVALGHPLELAVIDARGARLPPEVRLRLRYSAGGDQKTEDAVPMQFAKNAFVHRLDSVTRPLEYKAEGGDDTSMPWTQLEVVEPPAIESLSVTLHPPAYTGWSAETADKHFRAIKGTRVEIRGTASKRLTAAALKLENGTLVPGQVTGEGYTFTVPAAGEAEFVVNETGSYSFALTDHDGFVGGSQLRYEIRVSPDVPPSVGVEQPKGTVYVTAQATVPIALAVKDDLAIRDVSLLYLRSDTSDQGESLVPLYEGPPQVDAATAASRGEMGESRRVEHRWELSGLNLKPGTQVTFHGVAHDYLPQLGQSQPGRITIITPEELADRIAQRQSFILGELARALKMQQDSRSQVNSLEIQLKDVGHLERGDVDRLQGAELSQRQVLRALADPSEGVPAQIQGLLDDLTNNKLDSPDVERRMQQLLTEIERIEREHLTGIEQKLQSALKGAQGALDDAKPQAADKEVAGAVTAAGQEQDRVIASLEQMLGELSQWDNYRRFQRDIGQLRNEQEQVERETGEIGRETLTKDVKDLPPQKQADLKKLSQRQAELGRRFDRMLQQMEQMGAELDKTDPLAAGVIDDAAHQARQQGTGGQMRDAAKNVEQNQVGQAAQNQQQVGDKLQEMLDILANRSEHELSRLVKKLREAEQELSDLRERQQGLRKKLDEAAKNPNEEERRKELERLTREQRDLQEQTDRMARKLQRLQAQDASRSASKAGGKMSKAGQQGEQGDAGGAQDAAAAAEKDLDEAQQALAERRKQAEVDLAIEQLAKIEDGLKALHAQQQEVIAETDRLEGIRQTAGKWTRGQMLSVRDLARQQDSQREETDSLAKKLTAAEVFSLALKGAGKEMARAVGNLEQRDTGPTTLAAERSALRRLNQLLEALKPDKPEPGEKQEPQEGQGGEQGGQQQGDGIPSLAQLKLLKLMQEEVNERTKALQEGFAQGQKVTPEQLQELTQLSEEQKQLADMVLNLSKPSDKPPEEDPEKLPSRDPEKELEEKLK